MDRKPASKRNLGSLRADLDALRKRLEEREPAFESHSMELLQCLLENAPGFISMLAPNGTILFFNRVREGLTQDQIIGTSIYDFISPSQCEILRACIDRVVRTGKPDSCEAEAQTSDGWKAHFESFVAPITDGNDVVAVVVISNDISARKHVDQALRRSEEKLHMAVDAAGVGLWSWDPIAQLVAWEARLCAIFGVPPGTAPKGREGYLALVHPEDRARAEVVIRRGVEEGAWEDEHRIIRADGDVRWVMTKGTVLAEPEGRGIVLGVVLDVTERRHRDEQRRQAQKLEAVGQLTAGIAHNFNNLLMGVLPNLQLALRDAPAAIRPLLSEAEAAALRAADLVRQLTTYAGRGRPVERRVESIAQIMDLTLALCRTTFDRRITFETHYDAAACALVDSTQIEQALLNLLINARDALSLADVAGPRVLLEVGIVRAGDPELVLAASPEADQVRIRVSDTGIGMDSGTLARLYEPFFTTKPIGEGTGLGLATARAIVREHGGWMACESMPRVGTTFSIYLPFVAEGARVARAAREPLPHGGAETVLIVDDEPSIRKVVSLMLEAAGYTAKTAGSGQEAIHLIGDPHAAAAIALILLDVSMPGMPGPELRERLRELVPRARVLYFTGKPYEAADPADVVIEKPVTEARLLRAVREALDRV